MAFCILRNIIILSRPWLLLSTVILLHLSSGGGSSSQNWEQLKPGIAKRTFTAPVVDDKRTVEINVVRIDPAVIEKIKVINVYGILSEQKVQQFHVYSLREVTSLLNPHAIINGGFSATYTLPIAAGLLMENHKVVSRFNARSRIQTGVFCMGDAGFRIVRKEEYKEEDCAYALQSGPMLVEYPSKVGIYQNERQKGERYRRSAVAIDKKGRLLLIASSESCLYDLAVLLAKGESQGGLGCVVALNLSGNEQSGLYVNCGDSVYTFGSMDVPISSAIAVFIR